MYRFFKLSMLESQLVGNGTVYLPDYCITVDPPGVFDNPGDDMSCFTVITETIGVSVT